MMLIGKPSFHYSASGDAGKTKLQIVKSFDKGNGGDVLALPSLATTLRTLGLYAEFCVPKAIKAACDVHVTREPAYEW